MIFQVLLATLVALALGDEYDILFSGTCGDSSTRCACPPAGFFGNQPNFMFITVDQQRKTMGYLDQSIQDLIQAFPGRKTIRDKAVYFDNHYISAAACSPSRATFYTGFLPSLHGVAQVDGVGKSAADPGIHWLGEGAVPTLAHWLAEAGYNIQYRGKWHVSHADILLPGAETGILTLNSDGSPIDLAVNIYSRANMLGRFGFNNWVGNEPHGSNPVNTGTLRDPFYADQVVSAIDDLETGSDTRPFWLTASFVNPHDIGVWPALGSFQAIAQYNQTYQVPLPSYPPSMGEDLSTKPACQSSFIAVWQVAIRVAPFQKFNNYTQSYYYFQKFVDVEIEKVVLRMASSRFYNNTFIIFTADHGELLLSHGGNIQKWHNAYEEAVHVEFIVHHSMFDQTYTTSADMFTSHTDILPTVLGLAGVGCYEREVIRLSLREWNTEARDLPGKDLSKVILGRGTGSMTTCSADTETVITLPNSAYFMADDDPTNGDLQRAAGYSPTIQPNAVEMLVSLINNEKWKLVFYHNHTAIPTTIPSSVARIEASQMMGRTSANEWELYNLAADPYEMNNLFNGFNFCNETQFPTTCDTLFNLLITERRAHRIVPSFQNVDNPRCARFVC